MASESIDGTSFPIPRFGVVDLYCALVVTFPLLLLQAALWIPFTILTLPALAACWLYARTLPRPLRRIEGGPWSAFAGLKILTGVLALPALTILLVWVPFVWLWALATSLPVGLLVRGLLQGRWRLLRHNVALAWAHAEWPRWSWGDVCRALIGTMHRQGFLELVFGKPYWGLGSLLLDPVFKYALQCNLFLDELEIKYANEWIDPPRPDASFEYLREFTSTFVCTALHSEPQRQFIGRENTFAAHYPYPASPSDVVTGMQFSEADKGVYLTQVYTDPDPKALREAGRPIRLDGVERCVFHVRLLYTNPFHPLVGDVFVNVTSEHRVEHQMHCVASKSTYLGNRAYDFAHRLFATTFLRGAMRYFDRFGLEP